MNIFFFILQVRLEFVCNIIENFYIRIGLQQLFDDPNWVDEYLFLLYSAGAS